MPPAVRTYPYLDSLESYTFKSNYGGYPNTFTDTNVLAPRPFVESQIESSCYGLQGTNASNFNLFTNTAYIRPGVANTSALSTLTPTYGVSTVKKNGYTQAYS